MTTNAPLVLLVEDEPLIAFVLEEEIKEAGFEVVTASTVEEAMPKLLIDNLPIKAVVSDISLPGELDGWALGQRDREVDPCMVVIYMSGRSAAEWTSKGVPNSVMLQKPFANVQLLHALATKLNEQTVV